VLPNCGERQQRVNSKRSPCRRECGGTSNQFKSQDTHAPRPAVIPLYVCTNPILPFTDSLLISFRKLPMRLAGSRHGRGGREQRGVSEVCQTKSLEVVSVLLVADPHAMAIPVQLTGKSC
jgi:hypothetical protein